VARIKVGKMPKRLVVARTPKGSAVKP